jgi:hypothetical protein
MVAMALAACVACATDDIQVLRVPTSVAEREADFAAGRALIDALEPFAGVKSKVADPAG